MGEDARGGYYSQGETHAKARQWEGTEGTGETEESQGGRHSGDWERRVKKRRRQTGQQSPDHKGPSRSHHRSGH